MPEARMTTDPGVERSYPPARVLEGVEVVALGSLIASGLVAWAMGLEIRGYDYDEVIRAHSAWLASQGLRPYGDFFECHPPYFALLAPVFRAFPDPIDALGTLRVLGSIGNLLFLAGLAELGASVAGGRRWARLGLAVVACRPSVVDYLLEFRIDGWGYALATWGLCRFRGARRGPSRDLELGVVAGIATILFCPKLAFLPPLVALFDHIGSGEPTRAKLGAALAYAAGTGLAAGLFGLYLAWHGIDPLRMALLVGRFNAIVNERSGFDHGLFRGILADPTLKWALVAGAIGCGVSHFRRRRWPDPYGWALASWLVLQAAVVGSPFKQYSAPWSLFASGFIGCIGRGAIDLLALGRLIPAPRPSPIGREDRPASAATGRLGRLRARLNRGSPDLAAMALGFLGRHPFPWGLDLPGLARCAIFFASAALVVPDTCLTARDSAILWRYAGSEVQGETIRWMNQVTLPGDRVVAAPPLHPIDRPDSFFVWFNLSSPSGFDAAGALGLIPAFRGEITRARALEELEANPPALVLLPRSASVRYTAAQEAALAEFLAEHGYRTGRDGFALRPDRMDRALRVGLARPFPEALPARR